MPTSPKSGEKITRSSISQMQEEVAASGQALTVDDFSRGAIGSEHLNDTVIYCAIIQKQKMVLIGGVVAVRFCGTQMKESVGIV